LSVTLEFGLLEDRNAILENLEPPAGARLELEVGVGKVLPELGRQTGGPGLVVSESAVFDRDHHESFSRGLLGGI
jgi:hypothetical protein